MPENSIFVSTVTAYDQLHDMHSCKKGNFASECAPVDRQHSYQLCDASVSSAQSAAHTLLPYAMVSDPTTEAQTESVHKWFPWQTTCVGVKQVHGQQVHGQQVQQSCQYGLPDKLTKLDAEPSYH